MLKELQLKNFRCFEALSLQLSAGFNFFLGANGEGKTSILEAVCVLLRLQSQRSATLAPLIRLGTKLFALGGRFDEHSLEFRYGGLRRKIEFDHLEQRNTNEYLRVARVVSFANSDIEMARGSSEVRRRYLDFVGSQIEPRYRPTLRAYERALRSRNALLKATPPRSRELAAYDQPLIEHGRALGAMRNSIVARLQPFVSAAYTEISNSKERIDMYFLPGNAEDFTADLARSHAVETRLRQTVVGPHRDDIDLFVDGMGAQLYASEGQQRTLALSLKIGQARLFAEEGNIPVLLIDDIFGELEPERKNLFLGALPSNSQKLVTSTSRQWRENLEGRVFEIRDRALKIM